MTTAKKETFIGQCLASPAYTLEAYEAQRNGTTEAMLVGQAAKLGGATTIAGMTSNNIRKGLKKLSASQEIADHLLAKHERDTSYFLKRGRVWLHVLFNEPEARGIVESASVALRTEMGNALAGAGTVFGAEGFVTPETMADARQAVHDHVEHVVKSANDEGRAVSPNNAALAKQLKVAGHSKVKVRKPGEKAEKGTQKRLTLNALAENYANVTRGPASWIEDELRAGKVVAVRFKSETEAQAFAKAIEDAADKHR